jgi:glycosyltransferase involved in cell wall biosynthesis
VSAVRIARIITRLNIGGPAIQAIDLSRELRAAGFETCLIHGRLSTGEGDMTSLVPIGDTESLYVDDLARPISPLHDLRALWKLYRALCRWRPEIVHTHTAKAGALGRLAAVVYNHTVGSKSPARLVHTYHGHVFEGYFGSPSTRLFLFVERWLGRRTDWLVAISAQVRQDLLQTYSIAQESRVSVIPLGFNLDRLCALEPADRVRARAELEIPNDAVVVATVGRLTAIKQHSLFLDMAARVAARSNRELFLVVGDGELRAPLEAQAARLGIGSRVRFLGWRGDLDRIYGATDVFVLTSRNEGTPVALIEAMAAGVASVSTQVGGVVDVITGAEVGRLVPFGDPDRLAAAVIALAESPTDRERMGRLARASVRQRFDLRRLVDDIGALYRQLLQLPSQPL